MKTLQEHIQYRQQMKRADLGLCFLLFFSNVHDMFPV